MPNRANGHYFSLARLLANRKNIRALRRRQVHNEIHKVHIENQPATPGWWQSSGSRRQ